jgi:hypothetical protein
MVEPKNTRKQINIEISATAAMPPTREYLINCINVLLVPDFPNNPSIILIGTPYAYMFCDKHFLF